MQPMKGHVLVATDHIDDKTVLGRVFELNGVSATFVDTGMAAVQAAMDESCDLILIDTDSPTLGGLDAIPMLRQFNDAVPIVAITASARQESGRQHCGLASTRVISKPVRRDRVQQCLEKFLRFSHARPALHQADLQNGPLAALRRRYLAAFDTDYLAPVAKAGAARDLSAVAGILHKIVGTAGSFGYDDVGEQARILEQRIRRGEDENTLLREIEAFTTGIGARIKRLQQSG